MPQIIPNPRLETGTQISEAEAVRRDVHLLRFSSNSRLSIACAGCSSLNQRTTRTLCRCVFSYAVKSKQTSQQYVEYDLRSVLGHNSSRVHARGHNTSSQACDHPKSENPLWLDPSVLFGNFRVIIAIAQDSSQKVGSTKSPLWKPPLLPGGTTCLTLSSP